MGLVAVLTAAAWRRSLFDAFGPDAMGALQALTVRQATMKRRSWVHTRATFEDITDSVERDHGGAWTGRK
jgi:hypothetical protein